MLTVIAAWLEASSSLCEQRFSSTQTDESSADADAAADAAAADGDCIFPTLCFGCHQVILCGDPTRFALTFVCRSACRCLLVISSALQFISARSPTCS
jgi:hypothetical protein